MSIPLASHPSDRLDPHRELLAADDRCEQEQEDEYWVCSDSSDRTGRDAWQQHWQNSSGSTYFWNAYEDWAGDSLFDCLQAYLQQDPQAAAQCIDVITGDPDN